MSRAVLSQADPHELRRRILKQGYEPVLVIGKRPVAPGWQNGEVTEERLATEEASHPQATSTGIRTGKLVAFDNDIVDPNHARQIEEIALDELGYTDMRRCGAKPEPMLLYRCEVPLKKITISALAPGSDAPKTVVELLGQGQQFVAYGVHPKTGKEYEWQQSFLGAEPEQRPVNDIAEITPQKVIKVVAAITAKLKSLGYANVSSEGRAPESNQSASPLSGLPVSVAQVEEILSWVDPNSPREEWRDIIAAVRATPIADDPDESKRRDLAHRFSVGELDRLRRYANNFPERYTGPEAVDQVFDTMPPKEGGVGFGTLVVKARSAGFSGMVQGHAMEKVFSEYAANDSKPFAVGGPTRNTNKFDLIFPAQMRNLPAPRYVVETIIPDNAVTLLYGQPGSFKSFLLQDILASTAAGRAAFNKFETVQGGTVLLAGEAPYGTATKRWPALAKARGFVNPDDVPFALVRTVPLVVDPNEVNAVIEKIKRAEMNPRIVGIDTVARSLAGQDENDARAAGLMINAAERICRELKCAVVLVHHSGKDETRGARGSSAFVANADAVFRIARKSEKLAVTISCEKMKDADEPPDIHLQGEKRHGSLVFDFTTVEEFKNLTRKNAGPSRVEIGAALGRAGHDISTRELAAQLAGPKSNNKAIEAMRARLHRNSKAGGLYEAYVTRRGLGKEGIRWGLPPAPDDKT